MTVIVDRLVPEVKPNVWSHRGDRMAAAMAETDGWVWKNLDKKRREYWRRLAQEAILVMEEDEYD